MADTPNATPTNYNSAYTGPQIDAAVGAVLDKEAAWDEAYDGKLPAGGEVGQILEKTGAEDNAAEWRTPPFLVRPNLLDNWYFIGGGSQRGDGIFPINQRGQQSYELGSGQYGIDRWRASGSGLTESLQSDGVVFGVSGQTANRWFKYAMPTTLPAGKYTFSVLVTEITVPETGDFVSFGIGRGASVFEERVHISEPGLYTVTSETAVANSVLISFVGGKDASIKISAIKVELGDTQTLAHQENGEWVLNELPDYGASLLECQRYFQMFRTEALRPSYAMDCRPVMAGEPTRGTLTLADVTYYTLSV